MSEQKRSNEYKFLKPVEFEGKKYESIDLDLESLDARAMIEIERQYLVSTSNQGVVLKELNKEYQLFVAAKAAKMPIEFMYALPAQDFMRITLSVQNFLTGWGLAQKE